MAAAACSRLILITGGTRGGLGFEAARQLLRQGHRVILTFRDDAKAKDAVDVLRAEVGPQGTPGAQAGPSPERVDWVTLDLCSFASVRAASRAILQKHPVLDALLLNAGMVNTGANSPQATADGWEVTYQTNHLSHFLLVHLLLPALAASKAPGGARVVVVSSELHARGLGKLPASPSYLHNLLLPGQQQQQQAPYSPLQIYALSKLCNVWFTYKLSADFKRVGLPITCDAVSPGWVPSSNLGYQGLSWFARLAMRYILPVLPVTVSIQEGARRLADVVAGPAALAAGSMPSQMEAGLKSAGEASFGSGRYFARGAPQPSSAESQDPAKQEELWALSLQATGIAGGEYLPKVVQQ